MRRRALCTVSAQPSTCHAFSRISLRVSRLLRVQGGVNHCSVGEQRRARTDTARDGTPDVADQPVKTTRRQAERISCGLQYLSAYVV